MSRLHPPKTTKNTVDWKTVAGASDHKPLNISESTLAFAKSLPAKHPPLERRVPKELVFQPYKPPPGVIPEGGAVMAFDDFCGGWAENDLGQALGLGFTNNNLGPAWDGFIGYPELAIMAQRPEYRRIVEVISTEATRKWIKLESTSQNKKAEAKIRKLENAVDRYKLKAVTEKIVKLDGFFGRAHIYIDLGTTDDRKELLTPIGDGKDKVSLSKVGKGDLKRFGVVEPVWCYPTAYDSSDPLKPSWYKPRSWFCMGKELDSSRFLPVISREVPDLLKPAYNFGGLPLIQMCIPYVNNWLQTRQSVNDIISSFSTFVLATNLSSSLQSDGDQLFRRAALFNLIRDNRGLMMLDKDSEDFTNVSAPLGSLDQLQAQAQEHMASVSGIPLVKLLGIQPSGLNSSSEGEIRTFYDNIGAFQENVIRDPLTTCLNFVQLSEFGEVDPDITFSFVPLWSLDEKSEAERRKTEADTHAAYIEAGVIAQEEVREVLANAKDSPYDHIDPDDVPELPENVEGKPFHEREVVGGGEDPVNVNEPDSSKP